MASSNSRMIEQQNLAQMIKNMYYSRDGKNGYATYYSFDMEITFPEFSNRNNNVLIDCSDDVLAQRILAIDEDELKPSSQIVRLEEEVIGEAIESVNRKKELLENLEEELIAYKARCNRFSVRIDDRIAIVEARKLVEQARLRQQAEPLDLSRRVREEPIPERVEREVNLPVVRLQRFDQLKPEIVIQRCDAPLRQSQPPVIPPQEIEMADQQQINIELEHHAEPEVEIVTPEEVVMEIEEYSINSTESTDMENGKGVNLINLVTLVDPQIVKNPKRKRKRKNILSKSNGFAKRFANKPKIIPHVRESVLSKIAQSKKVLAQSKVKQDEVYTRIFGNENQKSTLPKFKIGKKGSSEKNKNKIDSVEIQSVNRSGALKVIKTIDVNSIKPGHCKITFENKLREKFRKRFHETVGNCKFVGPTDNENEVENAMYDRAIDEMENVPNGGQEAHNWAEQVLADEIAQNAQPPPLRINPPVIDLEHGEPREVPIPVPQPFPDNMRFGEEALQVLREYGRDVIVRMRLNEDRPQKAMIHLSMDIRENVFGERVETEWFGNSSYLVATRVHPIPDIRCRLDGAPFVFSGIKRRYRVAIFPFVDNNIDQFIATAYLVPPMGHTPDYALERITLGSDFLAQHIHSVHPGLMEITLRTATGQLVRKLYQLRNRMRH
ncbi:hypothetical protein V9T40_002419 [Parthenolecanium corni]|uniref:Uncharacterized protein n=1 Tax=Parthenolecanium corni TaxID=536013 RepID=A0AAN9Y3S6_9HEMI